MSEIINECPICLEHIECNKNIIVTECGHTFHCKCMMTNISHNGFSCPCCRTNMIDEDENENDEEDINDNTTDNTNEDTLSFINDLREDDMLRGYRLFNNVINNIEHDFEDIGEEYVYQQMLQDYLKDQERYHLTQLEDISLD